ncbi:MAG: carbohydrate-binding protein [Hamadaea sp.]|uniref:CBM35 domain-containing protein n=1 Tax=Hamadaea sp. TaxID=2024425 RepID=UPI00185E7B0E|nr:CBM35 domain-containing protein [Hamadaea sp.]NUT20704.1 carbohydrate-binding protein [Hamadaea sp.]
MKLHRPALFAAFAAAALTAAGILAASAASAGSTTYQAESAALSGGAVVATDHSGYTGSGFVGGYTDANKGNAATTFTVNAVTAGGYQLALRYANGTSATMTLSLYVNNVKTGQISLPATTNWDTWATRTDTVTLPAGSSSIRYKFDSADSGNVNLDSLTVTDVPAAPAGQYEAESATLSGGTAIATDHSGYTGSGFVGGYTDGNKGTAATTFAVNIANAGSATVTARYANGTGGAMTLSIYVNGAKVRQTTYPALANWDTWGTVAEALTLAAGANTIAYKFDTTDSGNVNLDNITVAGASPTPSGSPSPTSSPTTPPSGQAYEVESAFFSGGVTTATSVSGYTGTGYVTGFTAVGARVIRTVNLPSAATAAVTLRYANSTGSAKTLSAYVNGVKAGQISLAAGSGWLTASQNLGLRAGLNLIGYQYDSGDSGGVQLDNVTVAGGAALATRGATAPYTEYEAESGSTNGVVLGPDRTYRTLASESSGRRSVRLDSAGKYTQFTLTKDANAIVVRASIPDNALGTGITAPLAVYANGTKITDLTLSSKYSWVYGSYPFPNDPLLGGGHRFFDETRALLAATYPVGTVLKLQNDGSTQITVDLLDTELVAPAYAAPANSVDVTAYGATSGSGDDTTAFTNAISAAKSQGKSVWVPAGTFDVTARVSIDNVTIRGAGMWHTTIRGSAGKGGFIATGGNVQLADFTIAGDVTTREPDGADNTDAAMRGSFGTGSLIHNVWAEHTKVGLWVNAADGLYVVGVRVRDTFADGINLNDAVSNTRVDQSVFRNTGDDAMAMWSHTSSVTNSAFTFNTAALPMLSNTAAIYGGNGNRIEDNLLSDTVYTATGIAISTWHEAQPFSGTTSVQRNTITRAGGWNTDWASSQGGLWIYAESRDITTPVLVKDVEILDSTYQGLLMSWQKNITNLTLDHVTISGAGTYGIEISAYGSAAVSYVTVSGATSGGLNNTSGYTLNRGAGNSGF